MFLRAPQSTRIVPTRGPFCATSRRSQAPRPDWLAAADRRGPGAAKSAGSRGSASPVNRLDVPVVQRDLRCANDGDSDQPDGHGCIGLHDAARPVQADST